MRSASHLKWLGALCTLALVTSGIHLLGSLISIGAAHGRSPSPRPVAYYASGYEGQYVAVIPEHELVVVRLGQTPGHHAWDMAAFVKKITAAMPRTGDLRFPCPRSDPPTTGSHHGFSPRSVPPPADSGSGRASRRCPTRFRNRRPLSYPTGPRVASSLMF